MEIKDTTSTEIVAEPASGWSKLSLLIGLAIVTILTFLGGVGLLDNGNWFGGVLMALAFIGVGASILIASGFFLVNPNMARVLVLFGTYRGTVRKAGFWWTNPFTSKRRLSLRAHNLDGGKLKVNDMLGNPVEISAVVVWRVSETARASFDVENYEQYVALQSEAAVRHLATQYPYDDLDNEGAEITLRGSTSEIAEKLGEALARRLRSAGIEIIEARLNHLAYAPEIASAMLQRQQAKAIIAARRQIVEGAVGMVEMALAELKEGQIVELDAERKATLVGNLLVVLCGQENAKPMLNAGV
jgi:regulator of protease activity HflC (stomatin/prohibitin superfamily)